METIDWTERTINERIAYICKIFFGGTPTGMSVAIGVPRSTIRSIMDDQNRSPRVDVIQKIVAYAPANINPSWLLIGVGSVTVEKNNELLNDTEKNSELDNLNRELLMENRNLYRKNTELRDELDEYKNNSVQKQRSDSRSA